MCKEHLVTQLMIRGLGYGDGMGGTPISLPPQVGINEFSDMSPIEFAKTHFGYTKPEMPWGNLKNPGTHVYNGEPLADSVDWEMAMGWEATPSHRLHKYELGINEFSDMSPIKFAKTHFGYTKPEMPCGNLKNLGTHVYIVSHC